MSVERIMLEIKLHFHRNAIVILCSLYLSAQSVWLLTFFKISSFMLSRRKKFIQGWNKWWQNFTFMGELSF